MCSSAADLLFIPKAQLLDLIKKTRVTFFQCTWHHVIFIFSGSNLFFENNKEQWKKNSSKLDPLYRHFHKPFTFTAPKNWSLSVFEFVKENIAFLKNNSNGAKNEVKRITSCYIFVNMQDTYMNTYYVHMLMLYRYLTTYTIHP